MKRMILICAAIVSAVLTFTALASASKPTDKGSGGKSAAAKACAAEKKADKAAFAEKYGKHAMRDCIKGEIQAAADAVEAKNAAKECKAEQAADPTGFQELYGTNGNSKNAFGNCVSSKVDDDEDDEVEDDEVEDDEVEDDEVDDDDEDDAAGDD